ncbi:MAG: mobile mystery protein B [Gammaproteobacteria bacterium]
MSYDQPPVDAGATLVSDDDRAGLIPSYITLRSELNEAEQRNILAAEDWAYARSRNVLDRAFLDTLHRQMFGKVWRWAGTHRMTAKNISVDAYRIPTELQQLFDDCRFWIDRDTYAPDEIAARFHHRLVWVHVYPNGNGRHARLATQLLLRSLGQPPFTWGSGGVNAALTDPGTVRERYIAALKAADHHDYGPLFEVMRA